jgi:hypothetical protein
LLTDTVNVSGTPVLLFGPVDADYDVTLTGSPNQQIAVGPTSGIALGNGGGAFLFTDNVGNDDLHNTTQLRMKVGDSLYAVGSSGAISYYATPL